MPKIEGGDTYSNNPAILAVNVKCQEINFHLSVHWANNEDPASHLLPDTRNLINSRFATHLYALYKVHKNTAVNIK